MLCYFQVQTAEPSSPAITAEQQNFHSKRDAPDEVISGELTDEYLEFRKQTDIREPYRIPSVYLEGTKPFAGLSRPETPLIAFINARSGGYVGARLAGILYRALGQNQVVCAFWSALYHYSCLLKNMEFFDEAFIYFLLQNINAV